MKKFKLILVLAVVFGFIYSCNNSAVQKMSEKMNGDQSDHVCASCAKSADAKVTFENNSKTRSPIMTGGKYYRLTFDDACPSTFC